MLITALLHLETSHLDVATTLHLQQPKAFGINEEMYEVSMSCVAFFFPFFF